MPVRRILGGRSKGKEGRMRLNGRPSHKEEKRSRRGRTQEGRVLNLDLLFNLESGSDQSRDSESVALNSTLLICLPLLPPFLLVKTSSIPSHPLLLVPES
jgi:hypothetical protein